MARDYLGLEKETAEAFINRPAFLDERAMSRFYRTGDLVRYEVSSSIRFDGLNTSPTPGDFRSDYCASDILNLSIDVAAEVFTSAQKDPLVAFVEGSKPSAKSKLQSRLPTRLQEYMAPSHISLLQQLPRFTALKKLNRNELRVLGAALALNAAIYLPAKEQAHGHTEVLLQRLWSETFGITPLQIGAHDEFFCLDGDSRPASASS